MPGIFHMDTDVVERARVVAASTVSSLDGQVRTVDSEVTSVVGSPAWQMSQAHAYGGVNGEFCTTANVLNRALDKVSTDTSASIQDYVATHDAGQATIQAVETTPFGGRLR